MTVTSAIIMVDFSYNKNMIKVNKQSQRHNVMIIELATVSLGEVHMGNGGIS